jgi:hypothetical protein
MAIGVSVLVCVLLGKRFHVFPRSEYTMLQIKMRAVSASVIRAIRIRIDEN